MSGETIHEANDFGLTTCGISRREVDVVIGKPFNCPACIEVDKHCNPSKYAALAAKATPEPPAAVQAGDVRESQRCRAVTAISDQLFHPSDHNHKDAVKALRVLSLMTKSPAQPPALTALVEAAREYMDMRVHDDYCFAVTMENTQGECLCGYAELAAALTPFLDSAQPKQEAPDDAR